MAQPEIVSRGEIVASLGLGSNLTEADAGLIELLKGMVENEVRRYCGHNITQPTELYVHYLPARHRIPAPDPLLTAGSRSFTIREGAEILQLPQVFTRTSGLEVRVDSGAAGGQGSGDFGDEALLTLGVDYYLDADQTGLSRSGQLIRICGVWPARPRSIRVTYLAGFTAGELDGEYSEIKLAVIDDVAQRFRLAKSRQGSDGSGVGRIRSESIGGEYSVTYDHQESVGGNLLPETRERLAPYVSMAP